MKKSLKGKLTHNLGLKILSVVLAVFTWLIMVNVSNPLLTVTQTVPVEFVNEDVLTKAGLTYEPVSRNTVTVSYKIHVRDESRVSASDFLAYADLAQLYDVTGSIPVQVDINNYIARSLVSSGSVTANPAVVRIQTEPIQTKLFAVQVRTEGTEADGYDIGEVKLTPSRVTATGAESVIGQISSVGVEINVDGVDTDMSGSASVYLYDANGNRLNLGDDVELDVLQVNYTVSVLRVKDLVLDFQVSGTVAPGYRFTGVDSDVRTVSVVGLRSALANLTTLTIPGEVLNIDRALGDVMVEVNLDDYLPDNVSIVGNQPTKATVVMHVERLETRQFDFEMDQLERIGENEEYDYDIDEITVLQIRGLAEDLDTLDAEDIQLSIDLTDLEPGEHQVSLGVILDDGFDYMGPLTVSVRVTDPAAEDEGQEGEDSEGEDSEGDVSEGGVSRGDGRTGKTEER